jgi:uncharacterized RDD family membrane protein YckC
MQDPTESEKVTEEAAHEGQVSLRFAPWWKRALAFTIDKIILAVILTVIMGVVYQQEYRQFAKIANTQELWKAMMVFLTHESLKINVAQFILEAAYFATGWVSSGQTIGARIFRLAVISAESRKLNWLESFLRYGMLSLIGFLFWLPAVFVFNPVYRQRIQDVLVNSVVVEVPSGGWPKPADDETNRDDDDGAGL